MKSILSACLVLFTLSCISIKTGDKVPDRLAEAEPIRNLYYTFELKETTLKENDVTNSLSELCKEEGYISVGAENDADVSVKFIFYNRKARTGGWQALSGLTLGIVPTYTGRKDYFVEVKGKTKNGMRFNEIHSMSNIEFGGLIFLLGSPFISTDTQEQRIVKLLALHSLRKLENKSITSDSTFDQVVTLKNGKIFYFATVKKQGKEVTLLFQKSPSVTLTESEIQSISRDN